MLQQLSADNPNYVAISKQLALLELKLKQANINTDFLYGEYAVTISEHLESK